MAKKKSLAPVLVFGILLLITGGVLYVVNSRTFLAGRASPSSTYSLNNSYLFGSPLTAKANGEEKVKVTAFLLDQRGLGVSGKTITLSVPNVTVQKSQPVTDDNGQAIFYLVSEEAGRFKVSAKIDGRPFPQELTVNFK